jgi:hypothetical protein
MTDTSSADGPPAKGAPTDGVPATPAEMARLDSARNALLEVHRALLNAERLRYEQVHGRVPNNGAFLQLVIADPWFAWLRPMAQLVLMIDERTSDKRAPLGSIEAQSLLVRSRAMLQADEDGDAFQRLFHQALQSSPELAELFRRLRGRSKG